MCGRWDKEDLLVVLAMMLSLFVIVWAIRAAVVLSAEEASERTRFGGVFDLGDRLKARE